MRSSKRFENSPERCGWEALKVQWPGEALPPFAEELRAICITWNMKGLPTPEMLTDVLLFESKHHIYFINTQECLRPLALSVVYSRMTDWEQKVIQVLGPDYLIQASDSIGGTHLMLITHLSIAPRLSEIRINSVTTGFFNLVPNKGGIGISFVLNSKQFLIIGCHLAAGEGKVSDRNEGLMRITQGLERGNTFDCVLLFGDLNYRILGKWAEINDLIGNKERLVLLKKDELKLEMRSGRTAFGFKEGDIKFQPTYKLAKGLYDRKRLPSWTDRVLIKDNANLLTQESYSIIPNTYSDHYPVFSQFIIRV